MAVMKEWRCLEHGEFDGTHPICPGNGCDSKFVSQEFRTPVGIRTDFVKRHDAGMRKSAEMYRTNNWKSARPGETSFEGRAQGAPPGTKLLWGDESKKVLGRNFSELTQIAAKPLNVKTRDGRMLEMKHNSGMREAATTIGLTERRLPQAELAVHKSEAKSKERAEALAR